MLTAPNQKPVDSDKVSQRQKSVEDDEHWPNVTSEDIDVWTTALNVSANTSCSDL
jgi:rRNA maturation endonuclease Nob1